MTSKETTRKILTTLENWVGEYIPQETQNKAILSLLDHLQRIEGNKSFKDTMNALHQTYIELNEDEE